MISGEHFYVVPPLFRINILRVSDFVLVKTFTSNFTEFYSLISVNFVLFGVVSYPGELALFNAAFDILGNPWFITDSRV